MTSIDLRVTGMTCGGCENAVKRALQQLPGVESVTASHAANRVAVTFDSAKVDRTQLTATIETLGYRVAT
jgi:copper chaperone